MRKTAIATAVAVCAASWLVAHLRATRLRGAPEVRMDAVLARAKTGDLVVFKSRQSGSLPSRIISPVTHVGMIVRDRGTVAVVETHAKGDARALGVEAGGVHSYPLDQRARLYDGQVYICQLTTPLSWQQQQALRAALSDLTHLPYDVRHKSHLLKQCTVHRRAPSGTPRDTMFCSEFLALALVRAGVLPQDTNTECMTPSALMEVRVDGFPLFTNLVRIAHEQ